jgi:hypothetical protein
VAPVKLRRAFTAAARASRRDVAARRWARRAARTIPVRVAAQRGIRPVIRSPIRSGADSERIRGGFAGGGRRATRPARPHHGRPIDARPADVAALALGLPSPPRMTHPSFPTPQHDRDARDPSRRALRRRTSRRPDGRLPCRPRGDRRPAPPRRAGSRGRRRSLSALRAPPRPGPGPSDAGRPLDPHASRRRGGGPPRPPLRARGVRAPLRDGPPIDAKRRRPPKRHLPGDRAHRQLAVEPGEPAARPQQRHAERRGDQHHAGEGADPEHQGNTRR